MLRKEMVNSALAASGVDAYAPLPEVPKAVKNVAKSAKKVKASTTLLALKSEDGPIIEVTAAPKKEKKTLPKRPDWQTMFDHLEEFGRIHGHCNVPQVRVRAGVRGYKIGMGLPVVSSACAWEGGGADC